MKIKIVLSILLFIILATLKTHNVSAQMPPYNYYNCQWIGTCELGNSNCDTACNQPTDADCSGLQSQQSCEATLINPRQCDCSLPPPSPGGSGIYWSQLYSAVQANPGAFGFFARRPLPGAILSSLPRYLFPIAGLLLLIYLIYGGFRFLTSVGEPKNAEAAKHIITQALLGFVIIFVAYWLVQIVGVILGLTQIQGIFGRP